MAWQLSREKFRAVAHTAPAFVFILGLALLPGIVASFAGVAWLQQNYFPIVDRFEVQEAVIDDQGDVVISGTFYKLYPDWACQFQGMQWYMPATDPYGGEIRLRVSSEFGDKRANKLDNNRPKGYSEFHSWKIGVSEHPGQKEFAGFATHKCLGVISTRTHLTRYRLD